MAAVAVACILGSGLAKIKRRELAGRDQAQVEIVPTRSHIYIFPHLRHCLIYTFPHFRHCLLEGHLTMLALSTRGMPSESRSYSVRYFRAESSGSVELQRQSLKYCFRPTTAREKKHLLSRPRESSLSCVMIVPTNNPRV